MLVTLPGPMAGLFLGLVGCMWVTARRSGKNRGRERVAAVLVAAVVAAGIGWVLLLLLLLLLEKVAFEGSVTAALVVLYTAATTFPLVVLARWRAPARPLLPAAVVLWLAAAVNLFGHAIGRTFATVAFTVLLVLGIALWVVIATRVGLLRWGSRRSKAAQQREAECRAAGISSEHAHAVRENLLVRLYSRCGGLVGRDVPLAELAEPGDDIADVWLAVCRLEQSEDVLVAVPDPATWSELVQLTPSGARAAMGLHQAGQHTTYRFDRSVHVSGDQLWAGPGSIVVNRSLLMNSLNRTREEHGADVAAALEALAGEVERSGNPEAAELLDEFNAQSQATVPSKGVLRTLFRGIETALPAATGLADIATKLAPLIG